MKLKNLLLALLISAPLSSYAEEDAQVKLEKQTEAVSDESLKKLGISRDEYKAHVELNKKIEAEFLALPKDQQDRFGELYLKAIKLGKEKRTSEALYSALEAYKIEPRNVGLLTQMGAFYVELRLLNEARVKFAEALKVSPFNPSLVFNSSEVEFVSKNYAKALEGFQRLGPMIEVVPVMKNLEQLIQFKVELCHLALSKDKALDKAKREEYRAYFDKAVDGRDFRVHKPITYYGKAVKALDAGEETKAKDMLQKVRYIFNNPQLHEQFLDAIVEFGYLSPLTEAKEK